jgi:uncharacterized protein YfaS (alpha-2-macroglobulin family)
MTSKVYDVGDQPTITATIKDTAGALADPTAVDVYFLSPSGVQTRGTAAGRSSTGVYTWTFPSALDESGTWRVRFVATGFLVAAQEIIVRVRATDFTT